MTGEFVARVTESFLDDGCMRIFASDGENNLADVYASYCPIGFAPCAQAPTKPFERLRAAY